MGILQKAKESKKCWHCKETIKKGTLEYVTPKRGARHAFAGGLFFCITADDVGRAVNETYKETKST